MIETLRLGLVGSQIGRSLAPRFHVAAANRLGIDLTYDLFEHDPEELPSLSSIVDELRQRGLAGINVTYPFKTAALGLADEMDPKVEILGALNTLVFRRATTQGFNTDHSGLVWRWRQLDAGPPGVVAVLGAGGVGRAGAFAFADLAADRIRVYDVDPTRAGAVVRALHRAHPGLRADVSEDPVGAVAGADGVFNATPVGMHFSPGAPIDLDLISEQRWVFDAIYSPLRTELIGRAIDKGLMTYTGLDLFIGQGVDAFRHFTGIDLPIEIVADIEGDLTLEIGSLVDDV